MKITKSLVSAAFAGLLLSSCGGGEASQTSKGETELNKDLTGKIRIDGSSTVFPISGGIAEMFRAEESKVKVIVNKSGSGSGFKMFSAKEIEISDASRGIKAKEVKKCKAANVEYLELEVAYDGLAVLVNIENKWVDSLSTSELKKLWEPAAEGVIKTLTVIAFVKMFAILIPITASLEFDVNIVASLVVACTACRVKSCAIIILINYFLL